MNIPFDTPIEAFAVLDEGESDVALARVCLLPDHARQVAEGIAAHYHRTAVIQPIEITVRRRAP